MNVQPRCSLGGRKTPTEADRSVLVGVEELLPRRSGQGSRRSGLRLLFLIALTWFQDDHYKFISADGFGCSRPCW